jgi:hypothetical protein
LKTLAIESGRSIPLNVPPACEPQAPVPTSLGLTFSGFETATRKDAALEAATDGVLKRESESLDLWNSFEPVTVTDQRRKTFNVRSEMITRCKLNIQKYRETIAALEEQAGK